MSKATPTAADYAFHFEGALAMYRQYFALPAETIVQATVAPPDSQVPSSINPEIYRCVETVISFSGIQNVWVFSHDGGQDEAQFEFDLS